MNCPNCKAEMVEGALVSDDGKVYFASSKSFMNKLASFTTVTFGNPLVHAWNCNNCGKMELRTEIKNQ